MDVEIFSEWLRRQGHRVVRTESACWFDRGPRALLAFPWHRPIQPAREELAELLRRERAVVLRFAGPADAPGGVAGYDVVLEDPSYDLQNVSGSTRPVVRKALARCEIAPLTLERYAREGWFLESDTRTRQGRSSRRGRPAWERMARAAEGLPGFEVWGATVDGRLASTLFLARLGDCVTYLSAQSLQELWPAHANHALAYEVTRNVLARPGVTMVHYGLQGLDASPSVDDFKCHLGFTRRPVRYHVEFHPLVAPFVNPATFGLLRRARERWHESAILAKGEGLARVYLEGRGPARTPGNPDTLGRTRA
jgi:hypothetical protein